MLKFMKIEYLSNDKLIEITGGKTFDRDRFRVEGSGKNLFLCEVGPFMKCTKIRDNHVKKY